MGAAPLYQVWATRWDSPKVIVEVLTARGLTFSMPLSDHGECSFTASVEPWTLSTWRSALTPPVSGILVTRGGVPVWSGWLTDEREGGDRSFQFRAREWGSFWARVPAVARSYVGTRSDVMWDVVARAAAVAGQDIQVVAGPDVRTPLYAIVITAWDTRTVGDVLAEVSTGSDGLEWYVATTGTLDNPGRVLVLDNILGNISGDLMTFEYVEATGASSQRGGNVLTKARIRNTTTSATTLVAVDSGSDALQHRGTATSARLIAAGWPRMTRVITYSDPASTSDLAAFATGNLAAAAGVATGYELQTLEDDPDWTQVPRGSRVRVSLDTDIYGGPRPYVFTTRVLNTTVTVADAGPASIKWDVAEVLEV